MAVCMCIVVSDFSLLQLYVERTTKCLRFICIDSQQAACSQVSCSAQVAAHVDAQCPALMQAFEEWFFVLNFSSS